LRRKIVTIPARLARPQRRPILHLPSHWPWIDHWLTLWRNTMGSSPPTTATLCPPRRTGTTGAHRKSWADQQPPPAHNDRPRGTTLKPPQSGRHTASGLVTGAPDPLCQKGMLR